MLEIEKGGSIHLTRGDTARLSINIVNDSTGETYEMLPDDILKLTVKKTVYDVEPCILKKSTGVNSIHFAPADTKSLDFGKYLYDVQLNTSAGDVYTILGPVTFEVLKEVGD